MKYALIGYGKMGKIIEEILLADTNNEIVLKISSANTQEFSIENLQKADVAIEFTSPHLAQSNLDKCFDAGIPVVCGTTGWYDSLAEVKRNCLLKNGALIYASNFSIGVNLFFELNELAAKLMAAYSGYQLSITEIHHTEKKDAPSGTAIQLANQILKIQEDKTIWVKGENVALDEIPIISMREPNVPGTHVVSYISDIDEIELKHTAKNRKGFANGAILAAKWIQRKHGIFTMRDVLQTSSNA